MVYWSALADLPMKTAARNRLAELLKFSPATPVLRGILSREQAHRQEHMRGKKRRVETCIRRYEQHESFSDIKEFYVKKFLIQYAVCALVVALMVPLARAQSQPAGLQAAFAKDAGTQMPEEPSMSDVIMWIAI